MKNQVSELKTNFDLTTIALRNAGYGIDRKTRKLYIAEEEKEVIMG